MAQYNTKAIRELLYNAYNDEEFTILCFDHFPEVYKNITIGVTFSWKIQLLLDYVDRNGKIENLLAQIRGEKPEIYEDYLDAIEQRPVSGISNGLLTVTIDGETPLTGIQLRAIAGFVAHIVEMPPDNVHVVNEKPGSIILTLMMPGESVQRFVSLGSAFWQEELGVREIVQAQSNLQEVDLSGADLSRVDLRGMDLRGSNLQGADLSGTRLYRQSLREMDLPQDERQSPYLFRADLRGTDLRGVDLRRADLFRVNLRQTRLDDTTQIADKWRLAWQIVNEGAAERDLSGADLQVADLRGSNLQRANLSGANLREADLREADLRDANLGQADLRGADLRGAVLSGANLRGTRLEYNAD